MLTSILFSSILITVSYGTGMWFCMKIQKDMDERRIEDAERSKFINVVMDSGVKNIT